MKPLLSAQLSDGSLSLFLPIIATPRPSFCFASALKSQEWSHAAEAVHASACGETVNDGYRIEATSSI